jgi:hypothetical protein
MPEQFPYLPCQTLLLLSTLLLLCPLLSIPPLSYISRSPLIAPFFNNLSPLQSLSSLQPKDPTLLSGSLASLAYPIRSKLRFHWSIEATKMYDLPALVHLNLSALGRNNAKRRRTPCVLITVRIGEPPPQLPLGGFRRQMLLWALELELMPARSTPAPA